MHIRNLSGRNPIHDAAVLLPLLALGRSPAYPQTAVLEVLHGFRGGTSAGGPEAMLVRCSPGSTRCCLQNGGLRNTPRVRPTLALLGLTLFL